MPGTSANFRQVQLLTLILPVRFCYEAFAQVDSVCDVSCGQPMSPLRRDRVDGAGRWMSDVEVAVTMPITITRYEPGNPILWAGERLACSS